MVHLHIERHDVFELFRESLFKASFLTSLFEFVNILLPYIFSIFSGPESTTPNLDVQGGTGLTSSHGVFLLVCSCTGLRPR